MNFVAGEDEKCSVHRHFVANKYVRAGEHADWYLQNLQLHQDCDNSTGLLLSAGLKNHGLFIHILRKFFAIRGAPLEVRQTVPANSTGKNKKKPYVKLVAILEIEGATDS